MSWWDCSTRERRPDAQSGPPRPHRSNPICAASAWAALDSVVLQPGSESIPDLRDTLQRTLAGSYTIERELGGGGMSSVYVAEETALGRRVVIKILPPELAHAVSSERSRAPLRPET